MFRDKKKQECYTKIRHPYLVISVSTFGDETEINMEAKYKGRNGYYVGEAYTYRNTPINIETSI